MKSLAKHLSLFLIILIIFGCQATTTEIHLTDDELVSLLFDLTTMKTAVQRAPDNIKDSLLNSYRKDVLKLHNLSQEELIQIQKRMEDNPKEFDAIYTGMNILVDSLRVKEVDREKNNI